MCEVSPPSPTSLLLMSQTPATTAASSIYCPRTSRRGKHLQVETRRSCMRFSRIGRYPCTSTSQRKQPDRRTARYSAGQGHPLEPDVTVTQREISASVRFSAGTRGLARRCRVIAMAVPNDSMSYGFETINSEMRDSPETLCSP
jgi:hypothetical protein